MIVFENEGKLDIRAVKTFGVSSKEDRSTAIGYFGTGLKYAIAILLRTGHSINIVTGGKNYVFGVSRSKIRNDEFDIITMNGEELGFTTELGKDWELWMAFRELYSNTLDERGRVYEVTTKSGCEENSTYVMIGGQAFRNVYHDRDKYFLADNVLRIAEDDRVQALQKNKTFMGDPALLYYRGIRVSSSGLPGLFDYNFLQGLTLTEDRTIKSGWSVNWEIAGFVAASTDRTFIRTILMAQAVHEATLDFMYMKGGEHTVFLEVVGELRKRYKDSGINSSAVAYHTKKTETKSTLPRESCVLSEVESKQLDKAVTFCKNTLGLDLDAFKLIVAGDLGGTGQLGRADIDAGIMYISKQCFKEGTKRVAVALLEEYTHCKHRVKDETVEQKWVYLNMITSMGEQLQGEPL